MSLGELTTERLNRKKAGLYALSHQIGKGLERQAKMKAPWRDRTGNTRRAIHGGADLSNKGAIIYLAHGSKVGWYMEEGTGIYGPKSRPIVPKNAKTLRFTFGGSTIFAKSTKGMPKQPIIDPTMDNQWPEIKRKVRTYWEST